MHRCLAGKLKLGSAKEEFIKREVAFHMDELHLQFQSVKLDENCVGNAVETYSTFGMDSGKALLFKESEEAR